MRNLLKCLFWAVLASAPQVALGSPVLEPSWGGGTFVSPTVLDVGQSALFRVGLDGPRGQFGGFVFNSTGTVDINFGDGQTLHLDVPPPDLPFHVFQTEVPHTYNLSGSYRATSVVVGMTTWILPAEGGGFTGQPVSQTFTDTFTILVGVPEPQTYAMMLAGLGFVGWVARRKKLKTA